VSPVETRLFHLNHTTLGWLGDSLSKITLLHSMCHSISLKKHLFALVIKRWHKINHGTFLLFFYTALLFFYTASEFQFYYDRSEEYSRILCSFQI
jgi:hypothetical protein